MIQANTNAILKFTNENDRFTCAYVYTNVIFNYNWRYNSVENNQKKEEYNE